MIKDDIDALARGSDLNASLMSSVMEEIMIGKVATADIVDFLIKLVPLLLSCKDFAYLLCTYNHIILVKLNSRGTSLVF